MEVSGGGVDVWPGALSMFSHVWTPTRGRDRVRANVRVCVSVYLSFFGAQIGKVPRGTHKTNPSERKKK